MPMMPPSLSGQPPMGSSPVSVPSGSPGSSAGAMAKVREAINIMQAALPNFPAGSEPHTKILAAIQSISKVVPPSAEVPGVQQTALRDMQQNAGQNAMLKQVMSSLGGANAGGGGQPQAGSPGMAA